MTDPFAFQEYRLSSGARLFHQHRPEMTWCALALIIVAGHMHDPNGKEGLAHLVEHQLSNGRIGQLAPMSLPDLYAWIKARRMQVDLGTTSMRWSRYVGRAETSNFEILAGFMTDLVFHPGLDGDVERERAIIRSERSARLSDRSNRIGMEIDRSAFGDHRLATATGLPDDAVLDGLALADVQMFHQRYYSAPNARFVMIGGVGFDQAIAVLEGLVPPVRGNCVEIVPLPAPLVLAPPSPSELYFPREAGLSPRTVSVRWTWRMPKREEYAGGVAGAALRALLYRRLREELGWSYTPFVESSLCLDHNAFVISVRVDVERVRATNEEIKRILSDEDALRARYRLQRCDFEPESAFHDYTCKQVLETAITHVVGFGRVVTWSEIDHKVRDVTEDEMIAFLRARLRPEKAQLVMIENS